MNLMHWAPALLAIGLLATTVTLPAADAPAPLDLWPGAVPGETAKIGPEHDTTAAKDHAVAGQRVMRIGNVSRPSLTVFRPAAGTPPTGTAVVVCPGGGYNILAWDLEGTEICQWLNSQGVTGVLLKYRVPVRPGRVRHAAPLQDAQRALGLVRQHAGEWGVNPQRVGILGFSAGGHLAALASNQYEKRTYDAVDGADALPCRPDFTVLIYPAYLAAKGGTGLAPELTVGANPPPAFVVQTQDDSVGVGNAMAYALALQGAKVPVELHVFPTGGHGYGLRPTKEAVTGWPRLAGDWLRGRGLLAGQ